MFVLLGSILAQMPINYTTACAVMYWEPLSLSVY